MSLHVGNGLQQMEKKQCVSSCLLLTSLHVRGPLPLPSARSLVASVCVGTSSITTDVLQPVMSDEVSGSSVPLSPVFQRASSTHQRLASASSVIGLEPLRIMFPLIDDDACHGDGGSGPAQPHKYEFCIGLREADSNALLGVAICTRSGAWFPFKPCGGSARITFRYCEQMERKNRILRHLQEAQLYPTSSDTKMQSDASCKLEASSSFLAPTASSVLSASTSFVDGGGPGKGSRPTHSGLSATDALAVARPHSACSSPNFPLLPATDTKVKPENEHSSHIMSVPNVTTEGPRHLASSNVATSQTCKKEPRRNYHCGLNPISVNGFFTTSDPCPPGGLREREGQPRSLVFSNIHVKGFFPLSLTGSWRLEFLIPHPCIPVTKHTVTVPATFDTDGSSALRDTLTVDLPLFLRGEVQTRLRATWVDSNNLDDITEVPTVVEFDPIVIKVGGSEVCQQERRYHKLVRHSAEKFTLSELGVQLLVALKYFAPHREGQNGRPTSAHSDARLWRSAMAWREGEKDADAVKTKGNGLGKGGDGADMDVRLPELQTAATPDGKNMSKNSIFTEEAMSAKALSFGDNASQSNAHRSPPSKEVPPPRRASKEEVRNPGMGHFSTLKPATNAQLVASMDDLVPCYTEEQRRAVFALYDTNNRGYMTQEQILHFCRAHVALFDGHQNDANIVRLLQSLFPRMPRRRMNATEAAAKATSSYLLQSRKPCAPALEQRLKNRGLQTPSGRPTSGQHTAGGSPQGALGLPRRCITYDIFEVIALRLAGM